MRWTLVQPRLLKRLLISAALVLSIAAPAAGQPTAGRNDAGREATRRVDRFGDPLPSGAIARLGTLRDYIGFESGDVVLSPDGKTVTATSTFFDIPLKLWDVSTGQVTLELKELDPALRDGGIVRRAAFSPDGKLLAAGDALGTVRIGRTDTGRKVLEFPGVVPVAHLRFLSGGKLLAATDIRGTTRILPIGPREKIRTFTHRDRPVGSLQEFRARFRSPDGKLQAYFSRDGRDLLVRDVSRSREVRRFPYLRRTRGEIDETWESHIVFSPDSKLLAAGDTPASLCLWSLETGQAYRRFPHQDAGHGIAFTPDGKQLITGGMHFRYWDIVKGQEVRRFPKQSEVRAVAFGPKGETLVTADDATVRLWETSTGRPLRQYLGHRADVFEVAIDPDGKFLASGDVEGTLILWDFSSGKELRRRVQPAPVAASGEGGLRYPEIPSIAFSPDGKTLAATDQRGASLFDAVSGREVLRFPRFNRTVRNLAFAQDGKTLAAVYGHGVLLWDVATGREKHKLDHLQVVEAAVFGPEGKTLATVDSLGGFGVWDLVTGRRMRDFRGVRAPDEERQGGTSLAFLPDGKTLAATLDGDETVQIWDIATGQLRRRLQGHAGEVNAVTLSPDGKTLASSSDDGTTLLWEVSGITGE